MRLCQAHKGLQVLIHISDTLRRVLERMNKIAVSLPLSTDFIKKSDQSAIKAGCFFPKGANPALKADELLIFLMVCGNVVGLTAFFFFNKDKTSPTDLSLKMMNGGLLLTKQLLYDKSICLPCSLCFR